jgi:glycyl-tRNA synthetase beta chain
VVDPVQGLFLHLLFEDRELGEGRIRIDRLVLLGRACLEILRRLALLVDGVADRAEDVEDQGEGPALASAFDAGGMPTKAAEGFARKWGLTVDQLGRKDGRLVASRKVAGQATFALLSDLLHKLILEAARNRKTMRWGTEKVAFPPTPVLTS